MNEVDVQFHTLARCRKIELSKETIHAPWKVCFASAQAKESVSLDPAYQNFYHLSIDACGIRSSMRSWKVSRQSWFDK